MIDAAGTIGSIPKNKKEPNSPLILLNKEDLAKIENPLFNLIQSYNSNPRQII